MLLNALLAQSHESRSHPLPLCRPNWASYSPWILFPSKILGVVWGHLRSPALYVAKGYMATPLLGCFFCTSVSELGILAGKAGFLPEAAFL